MNPVIQQLGREYPDLQPVLEPVQRAFELLVVAFSGGGKLLLCGNGGSAADADHIVGELVKGFLLPRPLPVAEQGRLAAEHGDAGRQLGTRLQRGLPAMALTASASFSTAFANDVSPELVFAQQAYVHGRPGDVLLALSTSGNSANVLAALKVARTKGLRTIGLTGGTGGQMRPLCDVAICVPARETRRIQERHLPVYHALCAALEHHFFADTPAIACP